MLSFLQRLIRPGKSRPALTDDSGFVATQLVDREQDTQLQVDWGGRAADLGAKPFETAQGVPRLIRLLAHDPNMAALGAHSLALLCGYLDYVQLAGGKQVMGQNEQGDHLMIVLEGKVVETRQQPSGEQRRLADAQAGELLGDLTGLDGESRASSWISVSPVMLAVVSSSTIDRMLKDDPLLAAGLLRWMGKRVSMRLRSANARIRAHTRPLNG